jgi:hypothetical protein
MSYTGQNHTLTSALEQGPLQPLGIEIKADGSPRADGAIEKSTLFFRDAKCRDGVSVIRGTAVTPCADAESVKCN